MLDTNLFHGPDTVCLHTEDITAPSTEHGLAVVFQVDFARRARFAKQGEKDIGVGPSSHDIPSHRHNFIF